VAAAAAVTISVAVPADGASRGGDSGF
jgi:hypothetical protein